jgi:hypothetical protein
VNNLSIFATEWNFEAIKAFPASIGGSGFISSYLRARVRRIKVSSPENCS